MNKLLCYNTLENLKGYQPILTTVMHIAVVFSML